MREHIQVNVQTGERTVVPYTDEENRLADAAKAKQDAYEAEFGYINKRKAEYPSMGDQLDAIWKDRQGDTADADAMAADINDVKAKHPKG
jgi:cytochrome c556